MHTKKIEFACFAFRTFPENILMGLDGSPWITGTFRGRGSRLNRGNLPVPWEFLGNSPGICNEDNTYGQFLAKLGFTVHQTQMACSVWMWVCLYIKNKRARKNEWLLQANLNLIFSTILLYFYMDWLSCACEGIIKIFFWRTTIKKKRADHDHDEWSSYIIEILFSTKLNEWGLQRKARRRS